MKRALLYLALVMLISGCGNSDLESAVYERCEGMTVCKKCCDEHWAEQEKRHANCKMMHEYYLSFKRRGKVESEVGSAWLALENFDPSSYSDSPFQCRRCLDLTWSPVQLDIVKVTSAKTGIKNIWDVKIYCNCSKHGKTYQSEQYSYKSGRLKMIK